MLGPKSQTRSPTYYLEPATLEREREINCINFLEPGLESLRPDESWRQLPFRARDPIFCGLLDDSVLIQVLHKLVDEVRPGTFCIVIWQFLIHRLKSSENTTEESSVITSSTKDYENHSTSKIHPQSHLKQTIREVNFVYYHSFREGNHQNSIPSDKALGRFPWLYMYFNAT